MDRLTAVMLVVGEISLIYYIKRSFHNIYNASNNVLEC